MIKKYLIALKLIEIDYDRDALLEERLMPYITDDAKLPDIKIKIRHTSDSIDVKNDNIIKLSDIMYFYSEEKKDVLFYYDSNISGVIAKTEFSKDYRDINVSVYNLKLNNGVKADKLVFNIIDTAICYSVQMNSGFVFHSSSVFYDGFGVAFSAKSGTGKSTHTSLWLKEFPGTFIINDDTPIITLGDDGIFHICGTPWAGTTGINNNAAVPLKALVFIERAELNSVEALDSASAMKLFFEAVYTPITDTMFSRCLDTLNKLFLNVPVIKLKCNMDPEAAYVARDYIFR